MVSVDEISSRDYPQLARRLASSVWEPKSVPPPRPQGKTTFLQSCTLIYFPPDISGSGERFWANVRKAFILPNDYIHMNTGTTGSQPLFSLSNLAVYNLWKSVDPRDWERNLNAEYPDLFPLGTSLFGPSATAARQKWAADAFGANPDEIVLSYNTTDACNYIFSGTPWNPGDRIVTTQFEHPACNGPMAWARDYRGVQLVMVNIPSQFHGEHHCAGGALRRLTLHSPPRSPRGPSSTWFFPRSSTRTACGCL